MQTLADHTAKPVADPVNATVASEAHRQAAALAVQQAIASLDDALRFAGHTPGSWGIVLANGDCLINEPVIRNAARGLIRRGAIKLHHEES